MTPDPIFVDAHCHIAGTEFAGDLEAVVQRARDAGLAGACVILAADNAQELAQAGAVAAAWPAVRFSVGIHPHAAGTYADEPARASHQLQAAIDAQPLTRCVGEIGLDYHYDFAPREAQHAVFREQIRVARHRGLPIMIHTREAEDDTFRILSDETVDEGGGVFHCFTGNREMARRALDIGFYISLAGIVTFPRALELHEVATFVPLDRLLIETDSPFLAPVPFRGGRNEPAHVVRVAERIAALRGIETAAVASATLDNFRRLFNP